MKRLCTLLSVAALAVALVPAQAAAQEKINISIATGPTSGVYYPLGGGMASVLGKALGYQINAEATAGSIANLRLINQKKADVAMSMADASWDAFKGQDKFSDGAVPLRSLMVMYPNRMHIVTIEGAGINSVKDLKGKRVSTGAPSSATEVMAARVLEAAGMTEKDFQRERLDPGKSVDAIKDRKLDAFFWVGGVPTAAVTDLGATPGVKLKLVPHDEVVEIMNKKYGPLYVKDSVPAKSYPGQDSVVAISSVWNVLVVNASMSDQVAYNIVKTIFDKQADLIAVHKEAQNFKLEYQTNNASPIPFHPGAIKYFAERGLKLR